MLKKIDLISIAGGKKLLIFLLLVGGLAAAAEQTGNKSESKANQFDIKLYLPGLQFRYEDSGNQERLLRQYSNYQIEASSKEKYIFGLELNFFNEETDSGSVRLKKDFKETLLVFGFNYLSLNLNDAKTIRMFLGLTSNLGFNFEKVRTEFSSLNSIDESKSEVAYGLGANIKLEVHYILFALETKILASKAYDPGWVPTTTLKLGVSIPLSE